MSRSWQENPRLYEIAKRITLEAGFPYTDPRTGETTQPPRQAKPSRTEAKGKKGGERVPRKPR